MTALPKSRAELQREWQAQLSKSHPTEDEKFDVLALRDRIIRAMTATSTEEDFQANSDVIVTGTCPEICPEKERYERVKQGRVDSFERRTRMIKDFSRQAADQDMPLPSELRTPAALRATMDVLLRDIISDPPPNPESPSGWYDFVWRRVRAIRKEITQQRLTGVEIVGILEEITRFHIIAFHMFCEADQNQFAPKLNLENLNDCLATLSRLYDGMAIAGQLSPNVAEIRAYEMMLRVWTGKLDLVETIAKVDSLPEAERNSREIRFARKVTSAVNNRFFSEYLQLMSTADYVTACLMHYSLPMIQAKALDFLATASGSRSKSGRTKISVESLTQLLGLTTTEELVRFTNYHGLLYESGNAEVHFPLGFSRSKDPKTYPRLRSRLVEGKLSGRNMAEVVAKRAFTDIPVPDVIEINSFDEGGMYVGEEPFSVLIGKENVERGVTASVRVKEFAKKQPLRVNIPTTVTLPRAPPPRTVPSPRVLPMSPDAVRFPRLPPVHTQSSPSSPPATSETAVASFSPTLPGSSDRKRGRQASEMDEEEHRMETKRHYPDNSMAGPLSPKGSLPPIVHQVVPASPRTPKLTPSISASGDEVTDEKEAKVYPLPTHLQMIRARTVCQASGPLGAVFRAWREHATRHRRPTNYFGQVDPSDEQRRRAEQQRWEENQSLTWAKFPFRSQLLQGLESYCTLLFLYAAGRNGDELEEWLRTKLGDPEPYTLSAVRILTFEEEGKTLRIVFARVDTWDAMSVEEVTAEVESIAPEVNAALLYAVDYRSLTAAKELLSSAAFQSNLPLALFCHDHSMTQSEMELNLNGTLVMDVYVPQLIPTLEQSRVLFDCIQSLVARRLPTPVRSGSTTLLRLLTEAYCSFLGLYRTLKMEMEGEGLSRLEQATGDIWNALVEDFFARSNVDIEVDAERGCDELLKIIQSGQLLSFLKIDSDLLWESPGRYPEVFPIGSIDEIHDDTHESYAVFAAVSEKVVTISSMATVWDPPVQQKSSCKPDFELQLRNWLEKLDGGEDAKQRQEVRSYSSYTDSRSSSERDLSSYEEDAVMHSGPSTPPVSKQAGTMGATFNRDAVDTVRKDTQILARWFAKIAKDLTKLESV